MSLSNFKRGSFRHRATERSALVNFKERQLKKPKASVLPTNERNFQGFTIIAFLNTGSGGGQAPSVQKSFEKLLGSNCVFDLREHDPVDVLADFAMDSKVRIIACGGDGTIGWIESATDDVWESLLDNPMESTSYKSNLAVAIMPLGTGNDLSRTLGWGPEYKSYMKTKRMLRMVAEADIQRLDRWRCVIVPNEKLEPSEKEAVPRMLEQRMRRDVSVANMSLISKTSPLPAYVFDGTFCNYFSVGVEAQIAESFHTERVKNPHRFTSPMKNKMIYLEKGLKCLNGPKLKDKVQVLASTSGGKLEEVPIPKSCRSIILLNIESYAAGTKLAKDTHHGDSLIEVIFTSGLTALGLAKVGIKTRCSIRADHVVLKTKEDLPFQVDGEPWVQPPSLTAISYQCNRPILSPSRASLGACSCRQADQHTSN